MMDPTAAFSLATNVLEFIQFTGKLLAQTEEIRQSGSTAATFDLITTTKHFEAVTQQLENTIQEAEGTADSTKQDQALRDISNHCQRRARQISDKLSHLTTGPDQGEFRTFRQVLRTIWQEKRISSLAVRLDRYRVQLNTQILVGIHEKLNAPAFQQQQPTPPVTSQPQTGYFQLGKVTSEPLYISTGLYDPLRERLSIPSSSMIQSKDRAQSLDHYSFGASVESDLESSSSEDEDSGKPFLSYASEEDRLAHDRHVQKSLTNFTKFKGLRDREDKISAPHGSTFHWIVERDWPQQPSACNFLTWLSEGKGCYWINGKAASGKSVLMKYLTYSLETEEALRAWSGDQSQVVTASAFLSRSSGDKLQSTPVGLFRTLLFQILTVRPSLVEVLFPHTYRCALRQTHKSWTETNHHEVSRTMLSLRKSLKKEVGAAFRRLLEYNAEDLRIVLFIDGLDELECEVTERAEISRLLLAEATQSIKVVAASRPFPEYVNSFQNCAQLTLQEMTRPDMMAYTTSVLNEYQQLREFAVVEGISVAEFKNEIVDGSSGIFLWIVLVLESLITGLQDGDTLDDLRRRLAALPCKLEDLYRHMITNIEPFYSEQASQLLQLAKASHRNPNHGPLSAFQLHWVSAAHPRKSLSRDIGPETARHVAFYTRAMHQRLRSRCRGLLELNSRDELTFLHRTVLDFLEIPEIWKFVLSLNKDATFDVNVSLLASFLYMVKMNDPVTNLQNGQVLNFGQDELCQAARRCLEYCALAEKSSRVSQAVYVDELDRVMRDYWMTADRWIPGGYSPNSPFNHWTSIVSLERNLHWRHDSMLPVAVFYGLVLYVKDYLEHDASRVVGKCDRKILILVLRGLEDVQWAGAESPALYPDDHFEVLRLLLDKGVDAHASTSDRGSAWDYFLGHTLYLDPVIALEVRKIFTDVRQQVQGGFSLSRWLGAKGRTRRRRDYYGFR